MPKPRPQRRRNQSRPRSRAHKRKRLHFQRVRARRRPLPDNDVELVIFQRRIQQLFEHRLQPVNLIDEQDLLLLHVGDDRRQIALDLQQRRRRRLEVHAQFVGNNVGQRSLPQPRRPIQQHVIHGLAARPRRLNRHRQIFFDFGLPDKLVQPLRPQLQLKRRIVLHRRRRHQPIRAVIQIGIVLRSSHSPDITTTHVGTAASVVRPGD